METTPDDGPAGSPTDRAAGPGTIGVGGGTDRARRYLLIAPLWSGAGDAEPADPGQPQRRASRAPHARRSRQDRGGRRAGARERGPAVEPVESPDASARVGTLLRSREDYDTDTLAHRLVAFDVGEQPGWRVRSAALVTVLDTQVVVVDAEVEFAAARVEELEAHLTEGVQHIAQGRSDPHGEIMWVNRTLVGDDVPDGWLAHSPTMHEYREAGLYAQLGWGNNHVTTDWDGADPRWLSLVAGLVDAQVLWVRLDAVLRRARREITSIVGDAAAAASPAVSVDRAASIERSLIAHSLAVDIFQTQVQGRRRELAALQLDAWKFESVRERAVRRVRDLVALADQEGDRQNARYQSLVELILLGLGLTALLQTVLGIIQTAYSGGVTDIPGAGGGLLAVTRRADLDVVLGVVMVALLALLWVVMRMRRRMRS